MCFGNNLYLFEIPGEYKKPFPLLQNYIKSTKKEKESKVDNNFYKLIEQMQREVYENNLLPEHEK